MTGTDEIAPNFFVFCDKRVEADGEARFFDGPVIERAWLRSLREIPDALIKCSACRGNEIRLEIARKGILSILTFSRFFCLNTTR